MQDLRFAVRPLQKNPCFTAKVVLTLMLLLPGGMAVRACTIFVLTDANKTLFFNNEDFSNPATRVWFVPAGPGFLGCAYVGFDDGVTQGGVNTAGLAFDWVAGSREDWELDPALKPVRGNPAQRMIESCTTVAEAIAFFERHREPSFSYASILIADRTGASVIIGLRAKRLEFQQSKISRGFGYGGNTLASLLAKSPAASIADGLPLLRQCAQRGENATKYSTVYDLRTGDIRVFPSLNEAEGIVFNLTAELAKGGHYYDIPELRGQLKEPLRPLRNELKRFYLDEFPPITEDHPEITRRIQRLIRDSAKGTMQAEDYSAEFWAVLSPQQKTVQAELKRLGEFVSLSRVGQPNELDAAGHRVFRYRVEFEKIFVLQRFVLDEHDRVRLIQSEASEVKSGVRLNP